LTFGLPALRSRGVQVFVEDPDPLAPVVRVLGTGVAACELVVGLVGAAVTDVVVVGLVTDGVVVVTGGAVVVLVVVVLAVVVVVSVVVGVSVMVGEDVVDEVVVGVVFVVDGVSEVVSVVALGACPVVAVEVDASASRLAS
jgi:hypothetical protein